VIPAIAVAVLFATSATSGTERYGTKSQKCKITTLNRTFFFVLYSPKQIANIYTNQQVSQTLATVFVSQNAPFVRPFLSASGAFICGHFFSPASLAFRNRPARSAPSSFSDHKKPFFFFSQRISNLAQKIRFTRSPPISYWARF
jgi:hypothetical protein